MVTLTTEGNSLKFTFQDSQHYLQGNGEIIAPKGSLALITDDTDMCNFVKADSNDIFVSVTYDELGMTKSEILSWFAANAGSSGGGGGLTPEEAQEMIDSSISGKADTSAVTQALTEKVDVSAYTAFTSATESSLSGKADTTAMTTALADKLDISDFNTYSGSVSTELANKADSSALTDYIDNTTFATYSGDVETALGAKASQTDLETVSGNVNTLSGDVANKVDTSAYTAFTSATETALQGKADTSDLANYVEVTAYTAYTSATDTALSGKASQTDLNTVSGDVATVSGSVANKQDLLVSGTNIKTINNTSILGSGDIEISGGGDVDPNLDINSENAVANSAITKTIQDNELVIANALINLQNDVDASSVNGKLDVSAFTAYSASVDTTIASKASQTDLNTVSAATASNTTALGGYSLWKGTTAQYEAIVTKDNNTIYFVVD